MKPTRRGSIILAILASVIFSVAHAECGNFEPETIGEDALKTEFGDAVLLLKIGDADVGTGYIIDAEQGYILTDDHVVNTLSPGQKIYAISPAFPQQQLEASVVKTLKAPVDLALLKLVTPLKKKVRPIDITLRGPRNAETLYAMDYPHIGDQPSVFHEQTVKVVAFPDGSIEVSRALAMGGDSGGPLLDPSGSSMGTCRQEVGIGATAARYEPMSQGETLLDQIPLSPRMSEIDDRLRSGKISEEELKKDLVKKQDNPTNLELYVWSRQIIKNKKDYGASAQKLIDCPLVHALMHRGMDDLVVPLASSAIAKDMADASFHIASREEAFGHSELSIQYSTRALEVYRSAKDKNGVINAELLLAQNYIDNGNVLAANKNIYAVLGKGNFSSLPTKEKGEAWYAAGSLAASQGNVSLAIQRYGKASTLFIKSGDYGKAADALNGSADVKFRAGEYQAAQRNISEAASLYQKIGDNIGESRSEFALVRMQNAAGLTSKDEETLRNYLNFESGSNQTPEAVDILNQSTGVCFTVSCARR
ncbi:trypsin-like peptidase domain-containing protein [Paraburkholderia sp. CI3]|uniref:trypsin-like peptidase domain-containing protein n=1 Tax=Paraburkholderia sp. CI3 TaxID=2991060 RepID=UPI003D23712D